MKGKLTGGLQTYGTVVWRMMVNMDYTDIHRLVNAIADSPSGMQMNRAELLSATRWTGPHLLTVARAAEVDGLVVIEVGGSGNETQVSLCSLTRSGRNFVASHR